jgi:peptidylprolyl isomerase
VTVRPLVAALAALALAACGGGARAPMPGVDGVAYAPALGVDLTGGTRTGSGLWYLDVREGDGARAEPGRTVWIAYTGWLPDGTRFDGAAVDRPLEFTIGQRKAIRGFEEGVRGMRVGGRRKLVVPPALGYGRERMGPVPANAVLVFDVELVRVR